MENGEWRRKAHNTCVQVMVCYKWRMENGEWRMGRRSHSPFFILRSSFFVLHSPFSILQFKNLPLTSTLSPVPSTQYPVLSTQYPLNLPILPHLHNVLTPIDGALGPFNFQTQFFFFRKLPRAILVAHAMREVLKDNRRGDTHI